MSIKIVIQLLLLLLLLLLLCFGSFVLRVLIGLLDCLRPF